MVGYYVTVSVASPSVTITMDISDPITDRTTSHGAGITEYSAIFDHDGVLFLPIETDLGISGCMPNRSVARYHHFDHHRVDRVLPDLY
jgi:hypothetical protein